MITRSFPRPSILSYMCSIRSRESSSRAEVEEEDRSRPRFLSGNNSSGRKNSRGLNIRDSIEDGGTIVGGGIGFDWSDMAEEQVQTNMVLMAFSDLEGNQQHDDKDLLTVGCSRNMTENLLDENQILLKIPRKDNYVRFDMREHCSKESLTYLVAKRTTLDESIALAQKTLTPQQNGVAERRNRTLIEAARTMLADSKLPYNIFGLKQFLLITISNDLCKVPSEENSQDCIVMLIWKDTSYFDSPTKYVDNSEPKTTDDAQKQVEDGPNNENVKPRGKVCRMIAVTKDCLAAGQHVNTASPDVNTGSLKLNVVGPSVNTASSNEHDSPEDMFTMGVSSTLEATHIESFSDEDEP
ncbi:putative ribonuclease H-like domain-containing protein [Tanacetum coccineum]